MKSSALTVKLLAALVAGTALFTALPAEAHDRDGWRHDRHFDRDGWWRDRHYDRDDWHDDRRGHRHWRGHHKDRWDRERVIIREKVIVRRPPVREYHYYERPARVYSPYYRDPAIVIGVDLPPIVIPLR